MNMSPALSIFLPLLLATVKGIHGVEYIVTNKAPATPGGMVFDNQLGAEYTKQAMATTTYFIWRIFQQSTDAGRKNPAIVTLFLDDLREDEIAKTSGNQIYVGDNYIQNIQGPNMKRDFEGVLYHEMTHVCQWDGSAGTKAPVNVTEGVFDFVRLKANYAPPNWAQPGDGAKWDDGYSVNTHDPMG